MQPQRNTIYLSNTRDRRSRLAEQSLILQGLLITLEPLICTGITPIFLPYLAAIKTINLPVP
jgi:hypothetical protein